MSARILIVEDNQVNMDLMTYLLHAFGHQPLCATDGAMGVAMARGPDLVNHLKSVKRSLRSLRLSPKTAKPAEDGPSGG